MTGGHPPVDDTICAIATNARGRSAIAVVRLSGPRAIEIVSAATGRRYRNRRSTRALVYDQNGRLLDEVLVVVMPGPRSYTGEDVVELSCHGGQSQQSSIVGTLCKRGCRLAEPGEFTRRAVINGKMSLVQAEAVRALIAANTPMGATQALHEVLGRTSSLLATLHRRLVSLEAVIAADLDFPDEDPAIAARDVDRELSDIDVILAELDGTYERQQVRRDGLVTVLCGDVNVGKSSLFNSLLGTERAIVTEHPGTTRDVLEECLTVRGWTFHLVDTAGRRASTCPVENEGIRRAAHAVDNADLILEIVDARDVAMGAAPSFDQSNERLIPVANKADLVDLARVDPSAPFLMVSALTGMGLDALIRRLTERSAALFGDESVDTTPCLTSIRQREGLREARKALVRARRSYAEERRDICAVEVDEAVHTLAAIIGKVHDADVFDEIFSTFCLGK